MPGNNEIIRESLRSATDKELIRLAAKRAVEQSVMSQLTVVPLDEGMVSGMEFLLREPLPGELPRDYPGDPVLDAMRDELRDRIVGRFGSQGVIDG